MLLLHNKNNQNENVLKQNKVKNNNILYDMIDMIIVSAGKVDAFNKSDETMY